MFQTMIDQFCTSVTTDRRLGLSCRDEAHQSGIYGTHRGVLENQARLCLFVQRCVRSDASDCLEAVLKVHRLLQAAGIRGTV